MRFRTACLLWLCCASSPSWAGGSAVVDPWTGFYGGVSAAASRNVIHGYTTRDGRVFGSNASQESANVNDRAVGFGLFAGARRSFGAGIVAGVEADLSRLGHRAENVTYISGSDNRVAQMTYETEWLGTARVTLGRSFGDLLVYGTGGAAFATEKERRTQYQLVGAVTEAMFTEKDDATRFGFTLGAGAEWRFANAWSIRAEYLHVRFADHEFRFPDARGGAQAGYSTVQGRIADNTGRLNIVRVGLAYRFGGKD